MARIAARLRNCRTWHLIDSTPDGKVIAVCGVSDRRTSWQIGFDGQFDCVDCRKAFQARIAELNSSRRCSLATTTPLGQNRQLRDVS